MLAPGFDDSALPPDLDASTLHALLGGCPRDIRLYLSDSKAEISMVRDAAGRLRGGADIEDLLNDPLGGAESAHRLFLVRRDPDADVGSTGSDDAVLGPKGGIVFRHLLDAVGRFQREDRRRLGPVLSGADAQHAAL